MLRLHLVGDVSSDRLAAVRPVLDELVDGTVTSTSTGLHVDGWMYGEDARAANRELLSALRRIERRTRLRATWSTGGIAYRFFDYVPKGVDAAP